MRRRLKSKKYKVQWVDTTGVVEYEYDVPMEFRMTADYDHSATFRLGSHKVTVYTTLDETGQDVLYCIQVD